jgi:hypothetical protein
MMSFIPERFRDLKRFFEMLRYRIGLAVSKSRLNFIEQESIIKRVLFLQTARKSTNFRKEGL